MPGARGGFEGKPPHPLWQRGPIPLSSRDHPQPEASPWPSKHFPPPPGIKAPPLSFAVRTGDLLFVSGIPGSDPQGDLPTLLRRSSAMFVTNIKRVLNEAGGRDRARSRQGQRALDRASDVAAMNALYAGVPGPRPIPARTTCVVQALPGPKNADRDRVRGLAGGRWIAGASAGHSRREPIE